MSVAFYQLGILGNGDGLLQFCADNRLLLTSTNFRHSPYRTMRWGHSAVIERLWHFIERGLAKRKHSTSSTLSAGSRPLIREYDFRFTTYGIMVLCLFATWGFTAAVILLIHFPW